MLLVATGILAVVAGLLLKDEASGVLPGYKDRPAVAVPFLLMQNKVDRDILMRSRNPAQTSPQPQHTEHTPIPEETDAPETTATTEPRQPAQNRDPTPHQQPPTIPTEPTEPPPPVAIYGVDETYFDDALFIGDSRMVGVSYYGRLGMADYFADVGMNVFTMFSTRASDYYFDETNLWDLLAGRTYGKIFIMLGLNESGYNLDDIITQYRYDLDQIQYLQPDADIYLLKIYGVSRTKAEQQYCFSPANLTRINDAIEALADEETIFCLDPRHLYEDSEGYILDEVSGDGVHPYSAYAELLAQWLCQQTE